MKILLRERDLSDGYIEFAQQIGADGFDLHNQFSLPGVREKGYAELDGLLKLKSRLRRAGLGIFRVTPPTPQEFLLGTSGGEQEVDNLCRSIENLGRASIPIMSVPIHLGLNPGRYGAVQREHRGGYTMHSFELETMRKRLAGQAPGVEIEAEEHWSRAVELYQRLVPVAEDSGVKLALHPSDPPLPEALVSPRRWAGFLDAVPSDHSGLLYCIGTRHEAGVSVIDDIRHFGRKGKIFHIHFRNVRGTIPSTGGYEEVALDDGDMNMFQVLRALDEVGYDGGLQLDHMPTYTGDTPDQRTAWAYAVGYVRALLAALSCC